MNVQPLAMNAATQQSTSRSLQLGSGLQAAPTTNDSPELRDAFNDFVGQTFFSQMLTAMRSTVKESAYFNGGQTEKVFQSQLDQVLAEKLSDASAESFTGPMYELFTLPRR